jgi:hypothetical protein
MNERMKELAKQLGYNVNYKPSDDETDREYQVVSNDFAEKFAELIVRECMRMCDCADVSYLEHGCDKEASGAAGAKEIIKEWFEVEE